MRGAGRVHSGAMTDLLRLLPQIVAALVVVAFFLLAAVVLLGTIAACVRWRRARRRMTPVRRLPEDRVAPISVTPAGRLTPVPARTDAGPAGERAA